MTSTEPGGAGPRPDDAGFRAWVAHRSPVLRRKAYLLSGDWDTADDLVQEALVALYPKWSRVIRGGNVDAYANRVLFGKYVDGRRRPWRREHATDALPERPDRDADQALRDVEDADSALTRALAQLPANQRAVVVLRFTDDLSVDEIAHVLGLPPGTVKSRLSRAGAALREQLESGSGPQPDAFAAVPTFRATEEQS